MSRRRWNPAGVGASVVFGLLFGIAISILTSLIYGNWWYLLLVAPAAAFSSILWHRWYPRAYERTHARIGRPKG